MRPAAHIKPWLHQDEFRAWMLQATDREEFQRRQAIWMTAVRHLHATDVALLVGVSTRAVRKWIAEYNRHGPTGLDRKGHGGRRRALMTLDQELALLGELVAHDRFARLPSPRVLADTVSRIVGTRVSRGYVYGLLRRHHLAPPR